jgi:hypothetical protein
MIRCTLSWKLHNNSDFLRVLFQFLANRNVGTSLMKTHMDGTPVPIAQRAISTFN